MGEEKKAGKKVEVEASVGVGKKAGKKVEVKVVKAVAKVEMVSDLPLPLGDVMARMSGGGEAGSMIGREEERTAIEAFLKVQGYLAHKKTPNPLGPS